MDLKDIKAIIDLMKKNAISEFEWEQQDSKIRLKRGGNGSPVSAGAAFDENQPAAYLPSGSSVLPVQPVSAPPAPSAGVPEAEIKSPMIGTFYRSPSPESAPYVEIGTEVVPDTVVCIIEAMKVMNEIKAEAKGVITQILVENSKPVEFGQALFRIRPS